MEKDEAFDLLIRLAAPAGQLPDGIARLDRIVREQIPEALRKAAPPDFPGLLSDFDHAWERFRDFILFDSLRGKKAVALGGVPSSGRTCFLNSLMGRAMLPENSGSPASVPVYAVHGDKDLAGAINAFGARVPLPFDGIGQIESGLDMDGEKVAMCQLVKSILAAVPELPYRNIAFLDMPGCSASGSDTFRKIAGERILRARLNSSSFIVWLVPADAGTISADELEFISRLDRKIPKLFIISKADLAPGENELAAIKEKVRSVLDVRGIRYVDVLSFSQKTDVPCDRAAIEELLRKTDVPEQDSGFARSFRRFFTACQDWFDAELRKENDAQSRLKSAVQLCGDTSQVSEHLTELAFASRIKKETLREAQKEAYDGDLQKQNEAQSRLNDALALYAGMPDVSECLSDIEDASSRRSESLKDAQQRLTELQQEFFTEVRIAADEAGISMPEPSAADLIENGIPDVSDTVRDMLEKKRQQPGLLLKKLTDAMGRKSSEPCRHAGGSWHKIVLNELLVKRIGELKTGSVAGSVGNVLPDGEVSAPRSDGMQAFVAQALDDIPVEECLPHGGSRHRSALQMLILKQLGNNGVETEEDRVSTESACADACGSVRGGIHDIAASAIGDIAEGFHGCSGSSLHRQALHKILKDYMHEEQS